MILWYSIATIVVALATALLCIVEGARKRVPNDYTLGSTLLIAVMLVAQIIIAIIAPMTGNPAVGDPLEYWMYLIVALILPIGAAFWALIDRTRTANFILAVVAFSVAVMSFRMMVIWG